MKEFVAAYWAGCFTAIACIAIPSFPTIASDHGELDVAGRKQVGSVISQAYDTLMKIRTYEFKVVRDEPGGASVLSHEVIDGQKYFIDRRVLVPPSKNLEQLMYGTILFDGHEFSMWHPVSKEVRFYETNSHKFPLWVLDIYSWLTRSEKIDISHSLDALWHWDTWQDAGSRVIEYREDQEELCTLKFGDSYDGVPKNEGNFTKVTFNRKMGCFPVEYVSYDDGKEIEVGKSDIDWLTDDAGEQVVFPVSWEYEVLWLNGDPSYGGGRVFYKNTVERNSVRINHKIDPKQFTREVLPEHNAIDADLMNKKIRSKLLARQESEKVKDKWMTGPMRVLVLGSGAVLVLVIALRLRVARSGSNR